MYSIEKIAFGHDHLIRMTNQTTGEYVQVIPALGARIHELSLGGMKVIEGPSTYESLLERSALFEGAKLTPFPGRIAKGKYTHDGILHTLSLNEPNGENAIHGLVYDEPFTVTDSGTDPNSAHLELTLDFGGGPGYPFEFSLSIVFTLIQEQLTIATTLTNTSSDNIPVGDGWHAYFSMGIDVGSLYLTLPPSKKLNLDDKMIPTGRSISQPAEKLKIEDLDFDDCFELVDPPKKSSVILEGEGRKLEIWQETGKNAYNFVVIYIPEERDRIAIEPMTCAPNAFNTKQGLIVLAPDESLQLKTGININ